MKTRWELTPRGRLVVTLGSLALLAAWVTGNDHARLAASLLVAPLLIDLLFKGAPLRSMRIEIADRRTQSGAPFLERVTLVNTAPRRALHAIRLREHRTATLASTSFVECLRAGGRVELSIPARTRSRGRFRGRIFYCRSSYPLGFVQRQTALRCDAELISEPARVILPDNVLRALADGRDEPRDSTAPGPLEFYALREHMADEDARQVHALRSAATGTLVRRVTRGQHEQDACLVLDLRRPPGRSARRTGRRFEWSLGATATLLEQMMRGRKALYCYVLGSRGGTHTIRGADDRDRLLLALAEARPSPYATISSRTTEALRGHRTCFWVPAGGFRASDERADLDRVVLVTQGDES